MRVLFLAAAAALIAGSSWPAYAAAAPAACLPVASVHLYGSDRFEVALPSGVIVQAPGTTATSFYLDLQKMPGLRSRLQYSEPTGMLRVENGFMSGSGTDWDVYPATSACKGLAMRLGRTQSVRATSPGDPSTLPQNSVTTEK